MKKPIYWWIYHLKYIIYTLTPLNPRNTMTTFVKKWKSVKTLIDKNDL